MKNSVRILILAMTTFWGISETAGAGQDKDDPQDRLPKLQDLSNNMKVRLVSLRHGGQPRASYHLRFVTLRTNFKEPREFGVNYIPKLNPHEKSLLNVMLGCVDFKIITIPDEPHKATLKLILSMPQDADQQATNDHSTWFVDSLGALEKEEK
jgi:hypothetical protein